MLTSISSTVSLFVVLSLNGQPGVLAFFLRAISDLQAACSSMEGEYDKLVQLKTKGDLQGVDKLLN